MYIYIYIYIAARQQRPSSGLYTQFPSQCFPSQDLFQGLGCPDTLTLLSAVIIYCKLLLLSLQSLLLPVIMELYLSLLLSLSLLVVSLVLLVILILTICLSYIGTLFALIISTGNPR